MKYILVTGGAGYIGSVTTELLIQKGYKVIVFDNLSTGHQSSVHPEAVFVKGDITSRHEIESVFNEYEIEAVMHFASFSQVEESVRKPELYVENNEIGSKNLLETMSNFSVKKIIFSSTASVYGIPETKVIDESHPLKPINPYGVTKRNIEEKIINSELDYVILRYFNAAGASDNYGELHDPETHLIPIIMHAALGEREQFSIYGTDYSTHDGTCIRDYVHVLDIAEAHILALLHLMSNGVSHVCNLGSGGGYSVREIVDLVKEVTDVDFEVAEQPRRDGDPPKLVASNKKAGMVLKWKPKRNIKEILESAWKWHRKSA